MEDFLEPIFDYGMDQVQANAYKLGLFFIYLEKKHYKKCLITYPKTGDPRNSLLFKSCYKLVREREDLSYGELKGFITAQFYVAVQQKREIALQYLFGAKAKARWEVWKKIQKQKQKLGVINFANSHKNYQKIEEDLKNTRNFLIKAFGRIPIREEILNKKLLFEKYYDNGSVSGYYLACMDCTFIKKDLYFYEQTMDVDIKSIFLKIFVD